MGTQRQIIDIEPFQEAFVLSKARFPAFVAGWATGKTMCGIARGMKLSQEHPNNLGLIVREDFTDLRDSTIRDFEDLTAYKVGSDKDVKLTNGSVIMFRHGSELKKLQNINLGWFWIEQAEDFENNNSFEMLRGRLRRKGMPHTGFITANTKGHNWIWKLWKREDPDRDESYELTDVQTYANEHNLEPDFIADLRKMEVESLHHYNRYVLNSWEDLDVEDKVIPYSAILDAVNKKILALRVKRIATCDPAEFGNDETVIYGLENGKIIRRDIFQKKEPHETVDRVFDVAYAIESKDIVIDPIGVGSGIASYLRKGAERQGLTIINADGRLKATDPATYFNMRAEMWFAARERFVAGTVSIPDDDQGLQDELEAVGYKMQSDKTRKIDPKEQIRKADYLGHSPGRAEALVYGLWGEQFVEYQDDFRGIDDSTTEYATDIANSYTVKSVL